MVRLTVLSRLVDGLPLAEGVESDKELGPELENLKPQAKRLVKKLSQERQESNRLTIDSGKFAFHVLIDNSVCYVTLAEKSYPKKLAFQYLEELNSEFSRLYGASVESVTRPYAFIKFDTFIQKTRKLYVDSRTQRNLSMLNKELSEVHQIMTKSIQEVLGHGEKLDTMTRMSTTLAMESKKYAGRAKDLHTQALIRKYLPIGVVIGIVILVLYLRTWLS